MKVLALDCSTEWCSVALLSQYVGKNKIVERSEQASRKHTQYLLPMVDEVLTESQTRLDQIDAIAFACGPGSFTGLRICIGAVQGLAFGAGLPVVPVSTLKAQAQSLLDVEQAPKFNRTAADSYAIEPGDIILSTLDARMDEVYWAAYRVDDGRLVALGDERLTAPEMLELEMPHDSCKILALGSGHTYCQRMPVLLRGVHWFSQAYSIARSVAQLALPEVERGATLPAEQATPVYLRDEVAWQKQAPVTL